LSGHVEFIGRYALVRDWTKNRWWERIDVSQFQWLCFAYKIPPTSEIYLQVNYDGKGRFYYDLTGPSQSGRGEGTRLDVNSLKIIRDNEWHHTCTNLYEVT
jgi:hypothetical protein